MADHQWSAEKTLGNTALEDNPYEKKRANLTGVIAFLSSGAETAGREDEDLLGDGVDLTHALVVVHDRHGGFAHS
jgi:hypothetical protein